MRKLLVFVIVATAVLLLGSAASRTVLNRVNSNPDAPVFTSVYTLDTVKSDDLFVIADSATLLGGSAVQADAALVGRTEVTVNGRVDGDLTVMGGNIQLGKDARIQGKTILIGNAVTLDGQFVGKLSVIAETLTINPGTQLNGPLDLCASHLNNELAAPLDIQRCGADELAGWQAVRDGSLVNKALAGGHFSGGGFVLSALLTLGLAAFSGLLVTIAPRRFGEMTQAVRSLPARVSRVGCLTQLFSVALVAGLVVLIAVVPVLGLVLLPILALLLLPLVILFAIGWMTVALITGDWIVRRLARRHSPPMLTVITGSLGLFIIWTLLSLLPYGPLLSLLMTLLIGAVGLGAAIMTRVGSRSAARSYFVQG